jgi:hypothetical protein
MGKMLQSRELPPPPGSGGLAETSAKVGGPMVAGAEAAIKKRKAV